MAGCVKGFEDGSVVDRLLTAISKNLFCSGSSFLVINTDHYKKSRFFNDFSNGADLRERSRIRTEFVEDFPALEKKGLYIILESEIEMNKSEPFSLSMSVQNSKKEILNFGFRCINSRVYPLGTIEVFRGIGLFLSFYVLNKYYPGFFGRSVEIFGILNSILEKMVPSEKGHGKRVAALSALFGRFLRLDEESIARLFWAGFIHDLGKIAIPMHILTKNALLSDEERLELVCHPSLGAEIATSVLKNCPEGFRFRNGIELSYGNFVEGSTAILFHHERWNGKGYPEGLKGESIPLVARIAALADSYDAMVSERSYRQAMSSEEAINEIERCSGVDFDPYLAGKFIRLLRSRACMEEIIL